MTTGSGCAGVIVSTLVLWSVSKYGAAAVSMMTFVRFLLLTRVLCTRHASQRAEMRLGVLLSRICLDGASVDALPLLLLQRLSYLASLVECFRTRPRLARKSKPFRSCLCTPAARFPFLQTPRLPVWPSQTARESFQCGSSLGTTTCIFPRP